MHSGKLVGKERSTVGLEKRVCEGETSRSRSSTQGTETYLVGESCSWILEENHGIEESELNRGPTHTLAHRAQFTNPQ